MINLPTTTLEIAALNEDRLSSMNKMELTHCCKLLGLRGYSKQKKGELVTRVFDASNIDRQMLLERDTQITSNQIAKAKEKTQKEIASRQVENVITATTIDGLNRKLNGDMVQIASVLHTTCNKLYAPTTVAKNMTKKLKVVLPTTKLTQLEQIDLKKAWDKLVYAEHYAIKEREIIQNKMYSLEATKKIDTFALIDWAITHLDSTDNTCKGLALSLTSGRRISEIYGETTYRLGTVGIVAEGLSKKADNQKDSCEFVPLCDREKWLAAMDSFSEHGKTKLQVANSVSKLVSRHFPTSLKDLQIEKFKDCRDVYAAIAYKTLGTLVRDANIFVMTMMGHTNQSSTDYYRKYDCEPIESLKPTFKAYTLL